MKILAYYYCGVSCLRYCSSLAIEMRMDAQYNDISGH